MELGLVAVGTNRPTAGAVVGPSVAWRIAGRDRLVALLGAGTRGAGWLGRGEVAWQVMLDPHRRSGVSPFAGAGIAVERDTVWREWVMLEAGVMIRPGAGPGWSLSLGLGGGLRLMAAHRWWLGRRPPGG